jgi:hypothetical protein
MKALAAAALTSSTLTRVAQLKPHNVRIVHQPQRAFHARERVAQLKLKRKLKLRTNSLSFHARERVAQLKPQLGRLWPTRHISPFHARERVAQLKLGCRHCSQIKGESFPRARARGPIEAQVLRSRLWNGDQLSTRESAS